MSFHLVGGENWACRRSNWFSTTAMGDCRHASGRKGGKTEKKRELSIKEGTL